LVTVVLPAALAVALVAVVVAAFLDDGTATAPSADVDDGPVSGGGSGTEGAPRVGQDHWHALYQYVVCGVTQPPAPTWEGGVHTHSDGIIHIHPFSESEEGQGARLVKWFEYGGGVLTEEEVRLPGQSETHRNGDECPDGSRGVVQVFVNDERIDDISGYLPQDGDLIIIAFGPERELVSGPRDAS
jgi:hypothetical protein